jgi:hypothetical protein
MLVRKINIYKISSQFDLLYEIWCSLVASSPNDKMIFHNEGY